MFDNTSMNKSSYKKEKGKLFLALALALAIISISLKSFQDNGPARRAEAKTYQVARSEKKTLF